jgi:hypothetical protein
VGLLAALALAAPSPARAQPQGDAPSAVASPVMQGLGSHPLALDGYLAIELRRLVRAREIADAMLREDPDSPEGHCLLGIVYHMGEGSLPRAIYHLLRSQVLYTERYGEGPQRESDPWWWHSRAMLEAAVVHGAMGHNQEKLELLLEHQQRYQSDQRASLGWPLMRLRRYGDARAAVSEALESSRRDSQQLATALNALCGIEGEEQHRAETYRACLATVEHDRRYQLQDPVAYTNASIGARGLLRLDEAERLLLEATDHFSQGTVSNPWMDLMLLYLGEGRTAEALGAMRQMFAWRNRQPPYMDEQTRAQTDVASALLLLVAGRSEDAARISGRSLERPDRTGYTSSDSEQMEAASALVHTMALRVAAERQREAASWLPLREALGARLAAWQLDLRAWRAGRRAAAMLAERRILISSVRPYLPGGLEISPWTLLELPRLLGPGATAAAVREARAQETLSDAEGYFLAYDAQIAALRGQHERALAAAQAGLEQLPGPEVLMQAQLAALGARAAEELGQRGRSLELLSRAMQIDPGIVRRTRARLPARFARPQDELSQHVVDLLRGSPRFEAAEGEVFAITVSSDGEGGRSCLTGPQQEVLTCAQLAREEGEDNETFARRMAAEFHAQVFAPRVDLTQSDIRSLDGSPTAAGGRARERMNSILDGLVGAPPDQGSREKQR